MRVRVNIVIPKIALNLNVVRSSIMSGMRQKTVPETIRLFKQTTEGWEHKPAFSAAYRDNPNMVSATVFPSGRHAEIYKLVNLGSPPHIIKPRKAKFLRFQPGYKSSTRPRILSSRRKERSGAFVRRQVVNHPGFEPREFDEKIAEEMEPRFHEHMIEALSF